MKSCGMPTGDCWRPVFICHETGDQPVVPDLRGSADVYAEPTEVLGPDRRAPPKTEAPTNQEQVHRNQQAPGSRFAV